MRNLEHLLLQKDSRFYSFNTDFESFIPQEISEIEFYKSHTISLSRYNFLALNLSLIYRSLIEKRLSEIPSDNLIDFKFYSDGTAYDGTGIIYNGEIWLDDEIHLTPLLRSGERTDVSDDGQQVQTYASQFHPPIKDVIEMPLHDFLIQCKRIGRPCPAALELDWLQRSKRNDYFTINEIAEDGLVDIHGEPGGWQFNNED